MSYIVLTTFSDLFTPHFKDGLDGAGFWTMILTFVTIILCIIAWHQLRGLNKVSKADFINKFSDKFFNDRTRLLLILLNYEALEFNEKRIEYEDTEQSESLPIFTINKKIAIQVIDGKDFSSVPERYTGFDLDDLLLGYLEDIGCFEKRGLIDIRGVYDDFDWYIQMVWKNPAVKSYIDSQRETEENGDDIYENFEYIFRKSSAFERCKNKKELKIWFRIKWTIANYFNKRP